MKNCCCQSSTTEKTMDSSIEEHDSMNPHDLSFTWLNSGPRCPVPAEHGCLMQQDQLESAVLDELTAHTEWHQNSSSKKHESMNPQGLSFLQIDSKFNTSDPISPLPAHTASLMQQDQMEDAESGELNAPTKFHQNSFTEKHESMNLTQTNSSDPTCSVPTETVSLQQQAQREVVHTQLHHLCLPRKPRNVPSVSFLFVSNTYKVADLTFQKPKSRDETSRDQTPLPPISWQKENCVCLMRVLGPVCAALFAAYWGWNCFNATDI